MASYRSILLVLLLAGLLVLQTKCELKDVDEVEDLDDLDDDDDAAPGAGAAHDEGDGAYAESWGEGEGVEGEEEEDFGIAVDDKDVVVLSKGNYTDFLKNNRYVMVEFYAPWCGHCQSLAPEYAEASTKLKGEVVLAKIDATVEHELAQDLDVQGYPTLFFYVDGVKRLYNGHRTGDEIVKWIQKKLGPAVTNVDNELDAETILATGNTIAVAFISDLKGKDAEEFASAARQEDGVSFYQTNQPHVAALFKLKEKQQPSLALLKKEHQTHSFFEGKFEKDEILNFVTTNKLPLVITFSRDTASLIFENEIKKQLLLFANSDELKQVKSPYEEAAESFRGKLIFVHVDTQDEDAKSILEFFGLTAGIPKVIAFSAEEQGRKHLLEKEITTDNLKTFAEDFLADKLPPFLKSDPIPEKNDDDVKIVVGHNFDEIVLDESKDVLLEIYAPWCGHCQALEPIYNKLAKRLRGVDSLVIAKMDGTTNEHSRAKSDGFPTILFFPAGNKSFDPVTVDADRSVKALYKFIKKHAAIPFTLPKSSPSSSSSTSSSSSPSSSTEEEERLKDEL